ncbi:hypothetical protein [Spirillospora sp. CA-294931]|uniref:hypothetical protein n=1 Tax=Spirillospora sp. CA-294931 TaxID=3240042 RepID=UPI003D9321FE
MKATVITYRTRGPEEAATNQRLIEGVFAELAERDPDGVRYTVLRHADGIGFTHIVLAGRDDDALTGLAAFKEFQREIGDRLAAPPDVTEATVLGTHRVLPD